jgi:predicted RND superfamily exporter protein
MNTTVASDFQRYLDELEPWLSSNIPDGMTYKLAGSPVIWTAVLDELISSQLQSIIIALACVLLVMSLWMKSFRTGLLGTLPLIVTVIFYYASMTLFTIELNIGTAIISFLVLGIVDYSVHYLLRIEHGLKQGLSLNKSLEEAVIHSGRSIIINIIVFSIGFIALLFSEFKPIVDLGTLVGLSLFVSGIMSIFIITLLAPWLMKSQPQKNKGNVVQA